VGAYPEQRRASSCQLLYDVIYDKVVIDVF